MSSTHRQVRRVAEGPHPPPSIRSHGPAPALPPGEATLAAPANRAKQEACGFSAPQRTAVEVGFRSQSYRLTQKSFHLKVISSCP